MIIKKLLLKLSGVNQTTLNQCPDHQPEVYLRLGSMVLLTAIFGGLSGGYTFWTITQNLFLAVALGGLWSAVIMTVDRFFITTMTQQGIIRKTFAAIPRVGLAVLIGIVVATPLTLSIFRGEILERMSNDLTKNKDEISAKYKTISTSLNKELDNILSKQKEDSETVRGEFASREEAINSKLKSLSINAPEDIGTLLKIQADAVKESYQIYIDEIEGRKTPFTTGKEGHDGPGAKIAKNAYDEAQNRYNTEKENLQRVIMKKQEAKIKEMTYLNDQINQIHSELGTALNAVDNIYKQQIDTIKNKIESNTSQEKTELALMQDKKSYSLLAQLGVLNIIIAEQPILKKAYLLITAIFTVIELLPVIGKLLIVRQVYDDVSLNEEETIRTYQRKYFEMYVHFMQGRGSEFVLAKLEKIEASKALADEIRMFEMACDNLSRVINSDAPQHLKDRTCKAIDELLTSLKPMGFNVS